MDTVTSITLLEGLRNEANREAWERFNARYRPMVVSFARKIGLDESDRQDAAQDTMLAFAQAYREGSYDRGRGRLRHWLFGIAHRKVLDLLRRKPREAVMADQTHGTALLANVESRDAAEQVWDREWRRAILRECMEEAAQQFNETTLRAFRLFVLEEWPADKVATHLNISRASVYSGKNRVMSRLRESQARMEEIW